MTMDYQLRNRAAVGGANPVGSRPGLGRWLKSQLPGGERAMGLGAFKGALTSPAMVRDVKRGLQSTIMGGVPTGRAAVDPVGARRALDRQSPIPSMAQLKQAAVRGLGSAIAGGAPTGMMLAGGESGARAGVVAGQMARAGVDAVKRLPEVAANPVGALQSLSDKILGGGDAAVDAASVVSPSGQQWYPQGTGDWSGEPGGRYLSARYARQFGTWGMTYAGEGWRAIADRQGWDARLHPGFTQANLRYQDRPYVPRSGSRLYYEEL